MEEGETKVCSKCREAKPLGEYPIDNARVSGRHSICKACRNVATKNYRSAKPEMRWRQTLNKYGITPEDYYRMYAEQSGCCFICGAYRKAAFVRSAVGVGHGASTSLLLVDHHHATGNVRALVCQNCNIMVGYMEIQRPHVLRALRYIRGELEVCTTGS